MIIRSNVIVRFSSWLIQVELKTGTNIVSLAAVYLAILLTLLIPRL